MRSLLFLAAATILVADGTSAQRPATPCCGVTAIDAATGLVSAKITANGQVFQFKVADPKALAAARVGQAVYANFTTRQASLDGRVMYAITSGPQAPSLGVVQRPQVAWTLPVVSYGPPQPPPPARVTPLRRVEAHQLTTVVGGRNVSASILHLRGLKAVEQAQDLPPGARRLLEMHARTIPLGGSDHYMVNTQLAVEWANTHHVPDDVKPTEPAKKDCNNWYDSFDCAGQAVSDEWKRNWDQAVKDWDHAKTELTGLWNVAVGCFEDQTLPLPNIPVKFDITPSMTVPFETSTTTSDKTASGTVKGSLTLGFPIKSDSHAELDLFYIPCLPFVVRPKSLAASGNLTIGEELKGSVSAAGSFNKTFVIPPMGGAEIVIEVYPITIGDVPVAELQVSAYIEGNIEVGGHGKVEGHFQVDNPHEAHFDVKCTGGTSPCHFTSSGIPDPTTAKEGASIEGQVFVRPDIYTALQLDLDVDAFGIRAGPQPYLLGELSGCAAVAASQTVGGASSSGENHALTADLDWGVDLRAEAMMGGKVIEKTKYRTSITGQKHLWFRDIAPGGSNALVAVVDGSAQATSGTPAVFKVKMPSCYPYNPAVRYHVSWTGNAIPAPNPACQWNAGRGDCRFDPTKDLAIRLTWPAAGNYSLVVLPVGDDHDRTCHCRTFLPAPKPTQVSVTVRAGAGGGNP